MSRLEDHIPTIPCGATICMADLRMQKTGLAVMYHISGTEGGMKIMPKKNWEAKHF